MVLPGDILVEINGKAVSDRAGFSAYSNGIVAGEKVQLTIYRNGRLKTVSLASTDYPLDQVVNLCWELLGIQVQGYKQNGMIVTRVDPRGTAGSIGMITGDILYQVGDRETKNEKQFYEALIRYRNAPAILMVVGRNRYAYRVTIPLQ